MKYDLHKFTKKLKLNNSRPTIWLCRYLLYKNKNNLRTI